MPAQLQDFTHLKGKHCGSTALRNINKFYFDQSNGEKPAFDLEVEANVFGIGAGLGFGIALAKETPENFMQGRATRFLETFFDNMKIDFETFVFDSPELLVDHVQKELTSGNTTIVQCDVHYLPYYNSPLHFTGHVFLAAAFDDDGFMASDTHFPELQRVDVDSFKKSVSYPSPLFSGRNKCYNMRGLGDYSSENITAAIYQATKDHLAKYDDDLVADTVPDDPDYFIIGAVGRAGLEYFKNNFEENLLGVKSLQEEAMFLYQVIERRGTGGSAFRVMMAEYYANAATFTGDEKFNECHKVCKVLADHWREFASAFRSLFLEVGREQAKPADQYPQWQRIMASRDGIYEYEYKLLDILQTIG